MLPEDIQGVPKNRTIKKLIFIFLYIYNFDWNILVMVPVFLETPCMKATQHN